MFRTGNSVTYFSSMPWQSTEHLTFSLGMPTFQELGKGVQLSQAWGKMGRRFSLSGLVQQKVLDICFFTEIMSLNIVLSLFIDGDTACLLMSVLCNRDQSPREVLPGDPSKRQIKGDFGISSEIKSLPFAFEHRKVNGLFLDRAVPGAQLRAGLAVPRTLLWSGLVILPGSLHMRSSAHQLYFLGLEGHFSDLGPTDKVLSCLFTVRVAGATWLWWALCRDTHSLNWRKVRQEKETSFSRGVHIGQKVLEEDIPSLLNQKDVTETA